MAVLPVVLRFRSDSHISGSVLAKNIHLYARSQRGMCFDKNQTERSRILVPSAIASDLAVPTHESLSTVVLFISLVPYELLYLAVYNH